MAIALAALMLASAPAPEAVFGRWRTETRNAIVEIAPCGASACGHLLTSDGLRADPALTDRKNTDPKQRARPLRGLAMLWGFRRDADGWAGGRIYNPDDGKTYGATLRLADPQHLKVRGCIFVPLCKTQIWTRVAP